MRHENKPRVEGNKWRSTAVLGGLCLAGFGGMYWFISGLLDQPPKPVKQVVEVQVFRPPPPPPPEIEETPPPPEIEEEIEVPEPEALPDMPDMPDAPPAELLGLDADGVAGSDAFGLIANRGGTGLIGSEGRFRWYAQRLKDQVNDFLATQNIAENKSYKVRVLIWVDLNGGVERIRVKTLQGDPELDALLIETLARMERFSDAPPVGLPQPISLRIERNA